MTRAYEGAARPVTDVAWLKPRMWVVVESIDDKALMVQAYQHFLLFHDHEIAVLPGAHRVNVRFESGRIGSKGSLTLDAELRPGRKYIIDPRWDPVRRTWRPIIDDVTDQPLLWCAFSPGDHGQALCTP